MHELDTPEDKVALLLKEQFIVLTVMTETFNQNGPNFEPINIWIRPHTLQFRQPFSKAQGYKSEIYIGGITWCLCVQSPEEILTILSEFYYGLSTTTSSR